MQLKITSVRSGKLLGTLTFADGRIQAAPETAGNLLAGLRQLHGSDAALWRDLVAEGWSNGYLRIGS